MAQPTNREEFIEHCLRELGHPVIEINVDPDQVDDRVDDALQIFQQYHFDGAQRDYLTHELTAQDRDNEYIQLDPSVLSVVRMYPFHTSQVTNNIFNIRYQISLNDFYDISSIDLSYYDASKRHINLLDEILVGEPSIRFSQKRNRIYVDMDWQERTAVGDILLFETYVANDPDEWSLIWNDEWLKKYTTSLIKKQWGNNLKKFSGVSLPGGIELNGKEIFDEAEQEIEKHLEDLETKYSVGPGFFLR